MMLTDYCDRGARIAPAAPCLVHPDGTVAMTHAEFEAITHRVAAALVRDGLHVGDRVAVYSPNSPEAFACVIGVVRAGGTWVALNAASKPPELADLLSTSGCSRLIYDESVLDPARELIDRVDSLVAAVAIGRGRPEDPSLATWMAPHGERVPSGDDTSRVALILGTGGTTGRSKAVPVTHRQFHLMSLAFNAHLPEADPPRYICATPMTHAAGGSAFPVLAEGGSVIVHRGVDPAAILDSIEQHRATRLFLPPTAVYALLAHPDIRTRDLSSLRQFFVAGAPMAPHRLAEAVEVFGEVMVQTYGQSEAPMICTVLTAADTAHAVARPEHRRRLASCGRPSLIARVEIMNDDGVLLGPEEHGEIVIRSDLVFDGYWNNPEATAETVRPDGWHGTGDVGLRDEDGYVYIVDRKKDMIITGGFNVFPAEVEAVIHTVEGVADCAVIGIPDDTGGEAVTAVVEAKDGSHVDTDAIVAACKDQLGSVKAPKSVIVRDLPRSDVGKVLKRSLRDEYWTTASRRV